MPADKMPEGALVVPRQLSLITVAGFVVYVASTSWYASQAVERVTHLEVRDTELRKRLDERADANAKRIDTLEGTKERVIRLEEKISSLIDLVVKLDNRLDRDRR